MLSEEITAEDAKAFNIITHLVPETQLKTTVDEIAEKLAAGPTRAHGRNEGGAIGLERRRYSGGRHGDD